MQDRLDRLEHDYENLMEQIRLANQQRYGRRNGKSWTRSQDSCLFFNEAEASCQGELSGTDHRGSRGRSEDAQKAEEKRAEGGGFEGISQEEILHDIPAK